MRLDSSPPPTVTAGISRIRRRARSNCFFIVLVFREELLIQCTPSNPCVQTVPLSHISGHKFPTFMSLERGVRCKYMLRLELAVDISKQRYLGGGTRDIERQELEKCTDTSRRHWCYGS